MSASNSARIFRLFVSSTFSDFIAEREALQNKVFPELEKYCAERGARFQPVDLRWGVSEEASLDQQTMNICLEELRRCQETTPRPNFLILLGQRYGWRPLPAQIPAQELDQLLEVIAVDRADRLRSWYRLDENAVPPEYGLQPRHAPPFNDPHRWAAEENALRHVLLDAVERTWPADDSRRHRYERSATHQEIEQGALGASHPMGKVFAYFRTIEGMPLDARCGQFIDLDARGNPDHEASRRLEHLKEEVQGVLPGQQVHRYTANWVGEDLTAAHLDSFCQQVRADLLAGIDAEMGMLRQRSAFQQELDTHRAFAREQARLFVGREIVLEPIRAYLADRSRKPLVVQGVSGVGKTAVIAHSALQQDDDSGHTALIYRFLGATPTATELRSLLDSLCRQMAEQYADIRPVPQELRELVQEFEVRMSLATAERPLHLFLDALDQLNVSDGTNSLYWIPRQLPPFVKLVVSVLIDPGPAGEAGRSAVRLFREEQRVTVGPFPVEAAAALLDHWLGEVGRTLTWVQRENVLTKFSGCPLPLFLRVAFEEARHWKSYEDLSLCLDGHSGIAQDLSGVLNDLFTRLEHPSAHGPMLVRRVLAYLSAARHGLSEDELLGLLATDIAYFEDFTTRSSTERARRERGEAGLDRLPIVVWLRLYHDLKPYLTWREADSSVLMTFYHSGVRSAALARYSNGDEGVLAHRALARFFDPGRPWILVAGGQATDLRRLSEVPYQLMRGRQWQVLSALLVSFEFLEAKVRYQSVYSLLEDLTECLRAARVASVNLDSGVKEWRSFLDAQSHVLGVNPALFFQQALNFRDASLVTLEAEVHSLERQEPYVQLLNRTAHSKETDLRCRLVGESVGRISALLDLPEGGLLAAARESGIIELWDLQIGRRERILSGHKDTVEHMALTGDGRLLSVSCDGNIRFWDVASGQCLNSLGEHCGAVRTAAFDATGTQVHFLLTDGTQEVFDMATGASLECFVHDEALALKATFSVTDAQGHRGLCREDGDYWVVRDTQDAGYRLYLTGHEQVITVHGINGEGVTALTGDSTGLIRVWNCETRTVREIRARSYENEGVLDSVTIVQILPGGQRAVFACQIYDEIYLLDLITGDLIRTFRGHENYIGVLALDPEGRLIFSGENHMPDQESCDIKVWDLESGEVVHNLRGHTLSINDLVCDRYGKRLYSASDDDTIRVWDLDSGLCVETLRGHVDGVKKISLSQDGALLVSQGNYKTAVIWNLQTGDAVMSYPGRPGSINSFLQTDGGRSIILAQENRAVVIWDVAERVSFHMTEHVTQISASLLDVSESYVVTGSLDGAIKCWGIGTRQCVWTMAEEGQIMGLLSAPDPSCFLVLRSNHGAAVEVRRWRDGVIEATFGPRDVNVFAGSISPEGQNIVLFTDRPSGGFGVLLHLLNLRSHMPVTEFDPAWQRQSEIGLAASRDGSCFASFMFSEFHLWSNKPLELLASFDGISHEVTCAVITADNRWAVAGSETGVLWVYDLNAPHGLGPVRRPSPVMAVQAIQEGGFGLAAYQDGVIEVWNLESNTLLNSIATRSNLNVLRLYDDGKKFACSGEDGLRIFDLDTIIRTPKTWTPNPEKRRRREGGEEQWIRSMGTVSNDISMVVSADQLYAATGNRDTNIRIWELSKGRCVRLLKGHKGRRDILTTTDDIQLCLSRDGRSLLSGGLDRTIIAWTFPEGERQYTLKGHQGSVRFLLTSGDDTQIISGSRDGTVRFWQRQTGDECGTILAHDGSVNAGMLSADQHSLFTVGEDARVMQWDLSTRSLVAAMPGHRGAVRTLAVSPDGAWLATGGIDATVRIWDVRSASLLAVFPTEAAVTCCMALRDDRFLAGDQSGHFYVMRLSIGR